jgi:hypothetical protein
MVFRSLALGSVLAAAAGVAGAHAQSADIIDHWNTNAVMAAVQQLQASDVRAETAQGRASITAKTRDGLNVGVYARACDQAPPGVDPICHGLEAIISFDPGSRADRKALAGDLNHRFALGKFLDEPDGTIRVTRYVVFDGGVTPGNLRADLASLFAIGSLAAQTLWPEPPKR